MIAFSSMIASPQSIFRVKIRFTLSRKSFIMAFSFAERGISVSFLYKRRVLVLYRKDPAADQCLYLGAQCNGIERLCDIVICADVQSIEGIIVFFSSAYDDDYDFLFCAS